MTYTAPLVWILCPNCGRTLLRAAAPSCVAVRCRACKINWGVQLGEGLVMWKEVPPEKEGE